MPTSYCLDKVCIEPNRSDGERYDNLDVNWIKSIEIRDPYEGLEAADQQVQSIVGRRSVFEKRIIEYKNRTAKKSL